MKKNDWKDRLNVVYSTNPDFSYDTGEQEEPETLPKNTQKLRVRIEKNHRGGKTATIVNVGDSRAYKIDRMGIRQVTKDHSVVQLMVDRGEIAAEMARTYPGKNLITRAVGTESTVMTDVFHVELEKGDCLLLCSDGLSNMMDDQEILFEVAHGVNKQHCCQRLLDIVKGRGAPDNVTSVLIMI